MNSTKPTALVILDGFGYRKEKKHNAIATAKTPHLTNFFAHYPHAVLRAAGAAVGLPEGYMGNSEVGHLTIGSGRVTLQPISLVHEAIRNGSFFKNQELISALDLFAKQKEDSTACLHIMGLLSDAGVHSHIKHLYAFLDAAVQRGIKNIAIHAFLDGRDTPMQSAPTYLEALSKKLEQLGHGSIASIHGRFYAMDRDKNWERTEKSYRAITHALPPHYQSWHEAVDAYYSQGITDEFIPPTPLAPAQKLKPEDGIIFFNIRADRARQLTETFINPEFSPFQKTHIPLKFFITPVPYAIGLKTTYLFQLPIIEQTLKEILAQNKKTMFTIAETEKYAHVTYFFAGGKEAILPNEIRILIPSIRAKNYIATPAMSAPLITEAILKSLQNAPRDFYLINYANADMVGHSGDFAATVRAVETLDEEIKKLYDAIVKKLGGTLYITSDHGNAELMFDEKTGEPITAHTTSPVPFIMIRPDSIDSTQLLPLTELADIAPFILKNMALEIPNTMQRHHKQ